MNLGQLKRIFNIIKTRMIYGYRLKYLGKSVVIKSPLRIFKQQYISIGNYTVIGYKTWLGATNSTGNEDCELIIGSNCAIGNFNHIYATKRVKIGDSVLTADKVYISDNIHGYENTTCPIKDQNIVQKNEVEIGEESWIGENVCIIGASVGKHCVIGANSVVTKDIPAYCIAVGSPAKVIKTFNIKTKTWDKV